MTGATSKTARRLLVPLLVLSGCGSYGEVGSLAYEHVKSLYTVCNQKDAALLSKVGERIATAHEAGQLTTQEAQWLQSIIDDAEGGQWKIAAAECRKLLESQVTY